MQSNVGTLLQILGVTISVGYLDPLKKGQETNVFNIAIQILLRDCMHLPHLQQKDYSSKRHTSFHQDHVFNINKIKLSGV